MEWKAPHPRLREFIQSYWRVEQVVFPQLRYLYPEGGSGLILSMGKAFELGGCRISQEAFWSGPSDVSVPIQMLPGQEIIGVRFWPGQAQGFLGIPLKEIAHCHLNLNQWESGLGSYLLEELSKSRGKESWADFLDAFFLKKQGKLSLAPVPLLKIMQNIEAFYGSRPLETISLESGLSLRQIERQFGVFLGLSPKQYARIQRVRLARVILKKASRKYSLSEVGQELGYHDQAHFIREFSQVMGITPGKYQKAASNRAESPLSPI